ncbi:serine endoprotease [Corynebacterium gerontici]|uniref:Serine endoprotease n=2 Tax=Corynebacterium gerontici TaxID=2079234 RepID=A0A3G6J3B0_9CORY|nr:serine endoprotease [Corynebacterium gerontici]
MVALSSLLLMPEIPGTDVQFTVPYAIESPGPTFNTLGSVDGKEVVRVSGVPTDQTHGNLNMTTVAVTSGITLPQAIAEGLWSENSLVPIEQIFPQNISREEQQEVNDADFAASEASATTAALHYLDRPMEVQVAQVLDEGPAQNKLEAGDVVLKVDGKKVDSPEAVKSIIEEFAPGDEVDVTVKRGERETTQKVTLGERPHAKTPTAFLGITMQETSAEGIEVTYNLEDIGGPSAGLIFALAVVDKLDDRDISGGKFVAGTGTIDGEGNVGPIGGITHKIRASEEAGAEIFLAPAGNCAEVNAMHPEHIVVAKVSTLEEAVEALEGFQRGQTVATCE